MEEPRIVRLTKPSSDPGCDHCRRAARGNSTLHQLAVYKVQMALHCLWMYLCAAFWDSVTSDANVPPDLCEDAACEWCHPELECAS